MPVEFPILQGGRPECPQPEDPPPHSPGPDAPELRAQPAPDDQVEAQPHRWYSTNLVGVPADVLASRAFNQHPVPLHIAGTREAHGGLFALLERCDSLKESRDVFEHYVAIAFGLHPERVSAPQDSAEGRRWRSSWRRLLQGWGMDANGPAGAVLKGWVESRFGLAPLFHKARLERFPSPAWVAYLEEKAASRYHGNCIHQQLDLLYEFSQWALPRFGPPREPGDDGAHLRLWRGSTRCEEQVVTGRLQDRQCTVRLNSLASFTLSRDDAGCFGDWVFELQVPRCKLLVWPGLLPGQVLHGEQEVLALGGDYPVQARFL
ncbi:MAG TPA: NAD(+)--dinitrogen-reductase ADP-D-ribosyltransferase [Methyloversatilis sp.]